LGDDLAALGLTPVPSLEQDYEQLADLSRVTGEIDAHAQSAADLREARRALTQQLDQLGQDVPVLTQDDYASEPIDSAAVAAELVDRAVELAGATAALDATLGEWGLTVPALDRAAFVASPEAAITTINDYQRAADAVVAAHVRSTEDPSFVERLGEIGSTADTQLALADERLAAGDVDGAIAAADSANRAYDNWEDRGRVRLQTAAVTYGGLLLLIVVGLLICGRGRRQERDAEPAVVEGQTGSDAAAGDAAHPADAGEVVTVDTDG